LIQDLALLSRLALLLSAGITDLRHHAQLPKLCFKEENSLIVTSAAISLSVREFWFEIKEISLANLSKKCIS
jgi:hypothetical protein